LKELIKKKNPTQQGKGNDDKRNETIRSQKWALDSMLNGRNKGISSPRCREDAAARGRVLLIYRRRDRRPLKSGRMKDLLEGGLFFGRK